MREQVWYFLVMNLPLDYMKQLNLYNNISDFLQDHNTLRCLLWQV